MMHRIVWLLYGLLGLSLVAWSQPARLSYHPDSGRTYAALDPGQEILERNLLISNQMQGNNVFFDLSFDRQKWQGFGLGPRFTSMFSLMGNEGCHFRIRTQTGTGEVQETSYFLVRGKCYSVYWNAALRKWDLAENPCRRD